MTERVKVRFAPSPTGGLHVGSIRTALFSWLFARGRGGEFVLRIEDTDQARLVEDSVSQITEALQWLGLDWDVGPIRQSERLPLYQRFANTLVSQGAAYRCYCSRERLNEVRERRAEAGEHGGYDRHCRNLTVEERAAREAGGGGLVVRFAMPLDGTTTLQDEVRGTVTFENAIGDDFVLLKSDGFPTYHLANVVDDHEMKITHVLRAEEWLPSTPRHLQVYRALGWQPPKFAHLPIILAPDRSKLSKRHGATSVLEYRAMGYLPQAMVNFLALVGWSLDDKTEIISVEDLITSFSLERVSKAGAIFNVEKLDWMNGDYLRALPPGELTDALLDYWRANPKGAPVDPERDYLLKIVPVIQERLKKLSDAAPLIPFFFNDEAEYEPTELVQKGMDAPGARAALAATLGPLREAEPFDATSLEGALRPLAEELGLKVGQLLGALRVALTGLKVSPPLFETMEVLGRDRCVAAVESAVEKL